MTDRDSQRPPEPLAGTDQVKASVLRGYAIALTEMGAMAEVRTRLPAATLRLLMDPPPVTAWIPGMIVEHITGALADVRDLAAVRQCGRRSTEAGVGGIARGVIEGVLRLFGASPAALFSRYKTLSSNFVRNIDFAWEPEGETAGSMIMRIRSRPMSLAGYAATAGSFEFILALCKKDGTVSDPELLPVSAGSAARYRIRWTR